MERFRAIFQGVEDPRKSNAKKHDLNEMLMIALLACWRAWSSHKFDHPTRASFGRKIGWNI